MKIKGAKGAGASFKSTPDNLRSNDTFEAVLGMGLGPFKGPTRGLKSIKIDGTAIENETGELNFQDFIATVGNGDPTKFPQAIQLKLGAGATPTNVNLSLTNSNTNAPGPWIVKTVANTGASFLDLRFVVSQLFRQDKKGIYAENMTIEVQLKPTFSTTWVNPTISNPTSTYDENGIDYIQSGLFGDVKIYLPEHFFNPEGTWKPVTSPNYAIIGKTTSPAVYELRLSVPNDGLYQDVSWDVRCRLVEVDSVDADPIFGKRTVSWESVSAVFSETMGTHEDWRGVAWLQLYGKASDQLNGVPEVTGEWDTKIVSVPPSEVYDPNTRQYTTTIWDGSWSKAFTTDPGWIINDAISDPLSGISLMAPGSYLNKWDALEVSKWCSTLVPNGDGGTHPRYSMNIALNEPQKAEEFIRYLAGAVGGLAWDTGDGQWRMKIDKPETPVDIFTLENIEGEFIYGGTDIDTRYNDIIGQFKNADMDYREDAVRLYDNVSIANIGRKPTTIALVGCTNRQEAMRRVKLRLRSTINETKIINFVTNRRGRNIKQLDTILVADGDLGDEDKRTTGRVINISEDRTTVTVRDPLRLEVGVAYTIKFARPNADYDPEAIAQPTSAFWTLPTLVDVRTIANTSGERGNVRVLKLDTPLPPDVAEYLVVALEATGLSTLPKMYRVTNVVLDDDGERVAISGINIDTGKWDAADGVTKEDTIFKDLKGLVPPPVVVPGEPLLTITQSELDQGQTTLLRANWTRPSTGYVAGYQVSYSQNGGAFQGPFEVQIPEWELVGPAPADYLVEVRTIGPNRKLSVPLSDAITVDQSIITAGTIEYNDGSTVESLQPLEANAETTKTISLSKFSNGFSANSSGAVSGLPYSFDSMVMSGGVDVTSTSSYIISTSAGITASVDNTVGSPTRGRVTITALTQPGSITVSATAPGASTPVVAAFVATITNALPEVLTAWAGGDTPSPFTLGIVDSVDSAAWRTAIGLGTASTYNIGTSGGAIPLLNTGNIFSASQAISHPTASSILYLNSIAGQSADIRFRTGTSERWRLNKNQTAESGANSGSDFSLYRYDDSGVLLGTAFSVGRSSGNISFEGNLWPSVNNSKSLGYSGNQWSNVYTAILTTANAQITGGSITGIADLAVSDGGTGASTASGARTNLGLGTVATYNTGTSGSVVGLLSTANTFSGVQTIDGSTATPLIISRLSGTVNVSVRLELSTGSIHFGNKDGNTFAIKGNNNLSSGANWIEISSTTITAFGTTFVDSNGIIWNRTFTRTQALALTSPPNGGQIYVTNPTSGSARPYWYDSSTTTWRDAAGVSI